MRSRTTSIPALVLLVCAACGGAPAPDVHASFARIQVHESVIAHQEPVIAECATDEASWSRGGPREGSCAAIARVCEAADAICAIAGELDDADALARCALARRRCVR